MRNVRLPVIVSALVPRTAVRRFIRLAAVGCLVVLGGCKTFSADGGMNVVTAISAAELGKDSAAIRTEEDARAARKQVEQLLRRPLTADTAVQIALLNNRGLQAAYNELGLAEASMVDAHLPPNPSVSLMRISGAAEIEIERKIIANILALATLPVRAEIASNRFRQAQLRAAEETLRVAAETRRSYYRAVSARAMARFLSEANRSAETAAKLARRLGETGAMNKLDQAREQVFYAELTTQLATARQNADSERERLVRAMGLWGNDLDFKLPDALPALPRRVESMPLIEIEAVRRRIDLQIARIEVETLARSYGLTNATRFVNLLDLAGVSKTTTDRATDEKIHDQGIEVEFQVPLFDFGEVRVRQAEETYRQAVNRLAEKAVNVRSEARDAYRNYRSRYDIAGHYLREVLPLRKIISDEMLLRYNAMLIDVFALLTEARQRTNATMRAIEAQRDFWLAATDLGVAVAGGGMGSGNTGRGGETDGAVAGAERAGH
jgi:outer membrane protein TolC